ncbi:hypothetical protein cand_028350 [Cryptosporidium andersoni]|uniref:Uncharacterized protein n=1 Tax=Cryptosporidium andersoni TaxID=117008 RepID=A0A1J4MUU7_9CRYT|nr:hypothetical protein cand_028350 [Cryptosporidium andersoni]
MDFIYNQDYGTLEICKIGYRASLLLYLSEDKLSEIDKRCLYGCSDYKFSATLKFYNSQYCLNINPQYSKFESDLSFYFKLPGYIKVKDLISVQYYRETQLMGVNQNILNRNNNFTPCIRIVLSLAQNSTTNMSLVDNIIGDNFEYFELNNVITVSPNFEINKLRHIINNEKEFQIRILCRECSHEIASYNNKLFFIAPLPTEIVLNYSEALTCDTCCPLTSIKGQSNKYDFRPRPNWICIGPQHISIHKINCNEVFKSILESAKSNPLSELSLQIHIANKIHNLYGYNTIKYKLDILSCPSCQSNIGWFDLNTIYIWKYAIKFDKVYKNIENSIVREIINIFKNHTLNSLLAFYLEQECRENGISQVYIINKSDKQEINEIYSLKIFQRDILLIDFPLFIDNISLNNNKEYFNIHKALKVQFSILENINNHIFKNIMDYPIDNLSIDNLNLKVSDIYKSINISNIKEVCKKYNIVTFSEKEFIELKKYLKEKEIGDMISIIDLSIFDEDLM